jgi:hypothetical protein
VPKRIKDAAAIERRLLELAHTTDAKLTAAALAYYAPCSLDQAAAVLDDLAARDRLTMEVGDDGSITYELPGRQRIAPGRALVPVARPPATSPLAAAGLSLLIPGAGHLYLGRTPSAILWFFVVSAGYALLLPGLILHLFNIASASRTARRINEMVELRQPLFLPGATS